MSTVVTVLFLFLAFLFFLVAGGVLPAGGVGAPAFFVAAVFLLWAGLSRLP